MANLKGGTYEKQCKDLFHRLEAFGKGRHGKADHLTHSDKLAEKRTMFANDFKKFLEQNNIQGKMNQAMTNENIKTFLDKRLEGLKYSSQENYVRSFSSMLKGLSESNVSIPCDNSIFDNKVAEIKANTTSEVITGRSIANPMYTVERLASMRFESSVLAEVQLLGVRISECFEIVKNLDSYYNEANGTIDTLIGKGNHTYEAKSISSELVEKIRACENIPSENTYRNDLKKVDVEYSHDWRYTYAKAEFETKIENGVEYHQALREISEGLNHSLKRESMTLSYLRRA